MAWARQPWGMVQLFGEYLFGNSSEVLEAPVAASFCCATTAGCIDKERGFIGATTR